MDTAPLRRRYTISNSFLCYPTKYGDHTTRSTTRLRSAKIGWYLCGNGMIVILTWCVVRGMVLILPWCRTAVVYVVPYCRGVRGAVVPWCRGAVVPWCRGTYCHSQLA